MTDKEIENLARPTNYRYLLAEVEYLRAEIRLHEDRWIKTVTEEIAKQDQLIQENVELRKQLAEARLVLGDSVGESGCEYEHCRETGE